MLVEFKDFVAVVEAPQNEARSLAVIEEANRLVPNKLINMSSIPIIISIMPAAFGRIFPRARRFHTRIQQAVLPRHHVLPGAPRIAAGPHGPVQPDVYDQPAPRSD